MTTDLTSRYSHPILSYDAILHDLSRLNFETNVSALQNPTSDFVHAIFSHLWYCITQTSYEDLLRQLCRDTSFLADPVTTLYQDSMTIVSQFLLYREVMAHVSGSDARLLDVTSPDPKRFRRHLSGLLNCIRLEEINQEKMKSEVDPEELEQLNEELLVATREFEVAQQQYQVLKNQLDDEFEMSQQKLDEIKDADLKIQEMLSMSAVMDDDIQNCTTFLADKEKENEALKDELEQQDKENTECKLRLLKHDPAELRRNLSSGKREMSEIRNNIAHIEKEAKDLEAEEQNVIRSLSRSEKKLHEYEVVKQTLAERTELSQKTAREVEDIEEQLHAIQAEIRGKRVELENAGAEKEKINVQTSRLRSEEEQKQAEHERERQLIENKKQKQLQQKSQKEREIEEMNDDVAHLQETIKHQRESASHFHRESEDRQYSILKEIERWEERKRNVVSKTFYEVEQNLRKLDMNFMN